MEGMKGMMDGRKRTRKLEKPSCEIIFAIREEGISPLFPNFFFIPFIPFIPVIKITIP